MTTAHKNSMRGLTTFITDIRNCQNKEDEEKRVNKEMAKIRKKFKESKAEGYDRKKYVAKIIYMFMLGYEIDFGYMEALNLLSSNKFQEKLIGYLALAILLHENHEMLPLIIQSLRNDLQSRNEYHQCLALTAVSNIGGKEMSESLAPIVQKMLTSKSTKATIKKKSALCLLRLFHKYPELATPDAWSERIIQLLEEPDLGLLTSVMGLLLGLVAENPNGYEPVVKKVIWLLTKIIINRDYTKDYIYYNIANPWLQVKLLRFLSYYPPPTDAAAKGRLYEILRKILGSADVAKGQTVNHKNALNAVLFEAIHLIISLDDDRELIRQATSLLGRFISPKEHSNVRYLALEALGHMAALDTETANLVMKHQETVILALRDPDISIRKRALDLLYGMCDRDNSKTIVSELLSYLTTADYAIREELVLKTAILAEKFAVHYSWYVDVILQLIALAGDFVSDEIWFRVIQIVTNHEDIQEYAAKALSQPNCHETAIKVGGYILGEFGHLIVDNPGQGPQDQFEVLHSKFHSCSLPTKALLLSTYVKFVNLYPELTNTVRNVFQANQTSMDAEIQQRACEYLRLTLGSEQLLSTVWDVMPAFPEKNTGLIDASDGHAASTSAASTPVTSTPTSPQETKKETKSPLADLEEIFGATPAAQPQAPTSAPISPNPSSLLEDLLTPSQAAPVSVGSSFTPAAVDPVEFRKNCMSTEGVLYHDSDIQIGFKSEFTQGRGRMMLYYGNVSGQAITNFRTAIQPIPALDLQAQTIATTIEARMQMQQLLAITCLSEFNDTPKMQLSYSVGVRPVQLLLPLPILMTRFMEPLKLNGPDFFSKWREFGDQPPQSQQVVLKAYDVINLPALAQLFSTGFRLANLPGVDPNTNNLVCAGTFTSTTTGSWVCLLRVETNAAANMYRVTVRSQNGQVTTSFKNAVISQLGTPQ